MYCLMAIAENIDGIFSVLFTYLKKSGHGIQKIR